MICVVAAIIERNGKLLLCQRRRDAAFPLKWEFPGGKVHAGETREAALTRELREELAVTATIGRELYRTRHRYPEMEQELELTFYSARIGDAPALQNLAFETIEWARRDRLPAYDFLPADRELIEKIATGEIALP